MLHVFLVTPANVNIWFYLALQIMARRLAVSRKAVGKTDISHVMSVRPFAWNNEDVHRAFIG